MASVTRPENDPAEYWGMLAARHICRRHSKSFFFASIFLSRAKRDSAYAVYAFCRMIDDAIDHPEKESGIVPASKVSGAECGLSPLAQRLEAFQQTLDEIYAGRLVLPAVEQRTEAEHALYAFACTVRRYGIPKSLFLDMAQGCRMDMTIQRYATWSSLENYCYHVAGVVGLIMSRVFQLRDQRAQKQAVLMGNAMQLTNILRDVKEDFDRGRIYLPLEDMNRFGVTEQDIAAGKVTRGFRSLMAFEIARAREMYQQGAAGLCKLDADGSRLTASAMGTIYSGILDAIERNQYDVFSTRAHLNVAQKLMKLPAAWKLSQRLGHEPMPRVFRTPLASGGH